MMGRMLSLAMCCYTLNDCPILVLFYIRYIHSGQFFPINSRSLPFIPFRLFNTLFFSFCAVWLESLINLELPMKVDWRNAAIWFCTFWHFSTDISKGNRDSILPDIISALRLARKMHRQSWTSLDIVLITAPKSVPALCNRGKYVIKRKCVYIMMSRIWTSVLFDFRYEWTPKSCNGCAVCKEGEKKNRGEELERRQEWERREKERKKEIAPVGHIWERGERKKESAHRTYLLINYWNKT